MGDMDAHLTHDSLGLSEPTTKTASRSVQPFVQNSPQSVRILYNGSPLPQNCPFSWGRYGPPVYTCFLGPTRVLNPTDRRTDRSRYSVLRCGL